MKERRRYIRFKTEETKVAYFSHDGKMIPGLVENEAKNSMACILLGKFELAAGDQITWVERPGVETTVTICRTETVSAGIFRVVVYTF